MAPVIMILLLMGWVSAEPSRTDASTVALQSILNLPRQGKKPPEGLAAMGKCMGLSASLDTPGAHQDGGRAHSVAFGIRASHLVALGHVWSGKAHLVTPYK